MSVPTDAAPDPARRAADERADLTLGEIRALGTQFDAWAESHPALSPFDAFMAGARAGLARGRGEAEALKLALWHVFGGRFAIYEMPQCADGTPWSEAWQAILRARDEGAALFATEAPDGDE